MTNQNSLNSNDKKISSNQLPKNTKKNILNKSLIDQFNSFFQTFSKKHPSELSVNSTDEPKSEKKKEKNQFDSSVTKHIKTIIEKKELKETFPEISNEMINQIQEVMILKLVPLIEQANKIPGITHMFQINFMDSKTNDLAIKINKQNTHQSLTLEMGPDLLKLFNPNVLNELKIHLKKKNITIDDIVITELSEDQQNIKKRKNHKHIQKNTLY